jgi:hypothetical protein
MPATMIARHLAGLQRLHLLGRDQCVHLLFRLFVDLPDFLLPLLRTERRLGANRLDLSARPPLDCAPFLHRRLRDPSLLPARRLMRLRRSHHRAGMPWQRRLNMNGHRLRGCTFDWSSQNGNHQQASAKGESAFEHNLFLRRPQPHTGFKVAEESFESLQPRT